MTVGDRKPRHPWQMHIVPLKFLFPALSGILASVAGAHPVPDVPVRASFEADGSAMIQVEVDLRCFSGDPLNEPSTLNWVLEEMTEAEREEQRAQARELIRRIVDFEFEPSGRFVPEFTFEFTAPGGGALSKIDDIVVLAGEWRTTMPTGVKGYRIHALPVGELSVVFQNELEGQPVKRRQVLFPGESSYLLELTGLAEEPPSPAGAVAGGVAIKAGAAAGRWTKLSIIAGSIVVAAAGLIWMVRRKAIG